MGQYAKVLVDAVLQDDRVLPTGWRLFDYSVPCSMSSTIYPGQAVQIPFGGRTVQGLIVQLTDRTKVEKHKVKEIKEIISEDPFLSEIDISLCRWMTRRFMCDPVQVVRLFLPPGLRESGTVGPSKVRRLVLDVDDVSDANSQLERAQKQKDVLCAARRSARPLKRKELAKIAGCSPSTVDAVVSKGFLKWIEIPSQDRPYSNISEDEGEKPPHQLTEAQGNALAEILNTIDKDSPSPFLLHGVTGSGKTEVYLRVIERVLARGQGAILLVPEISLTPQMVSRVRARLGDEVAVLHSSLTLTQRQTEWYRLFSGEARVALGARSAVFAPCRNLGVIILDEEHENSYKQDNAPRYHAREVALKRSALNQCLTILGSATPSIETFDRADKGRIRTVRLPKRVDDRPMPEIELVDMRAEKKEGNRSIFSRRLMEEMHKHLQDGQQILLFLNQRGYSAFLMCADCGQVVNCRRCNVSLTYHWDARAVKCHYCGFTQAPPEVCPQCGGYDMFRGGTGTQKVEAAVRSSFPGAQIARMDSDIARKRGKREEIYGEFSRGELDVLVGTQMIAKGWDIPGVTLVGVVDADTALHFPDFRSAERTFQLITQVAGRCGRGDKPGTVIVQTRNPDHPALQFALAGELESFYREELNQRQQTRYPPHGYLSRILIRGESEQLVRMWGRQVRDKLSRCVDAIDSEQIEILGPVAAPLDKLRGKHRWHLFLKAERLKTLLKTMQRGLNDMHRGSDDPRIMIDVDPMQML